MHTGILTFIRDLLFLNFIDHADTTYWFIFFIIVMYCKYNIHFDIWLPLPYWIRLTNSLWAFPLMIIGLYLCKLINFTKFLQGFVKISGALSLELYLGHVSARIFPYCPPHVPVYSLAIPGHDRPLLPRQLYLKMAGKQDPRPTLATVA
ncbi:hypothetical protein [Lactobacillus delbrueckii]|uniref:hypothetical protein n=1 Tax=Lactobacillus delbrueckii TaxID=1584 RepID=UPI0012F784B8|nr:hypothetical protein [Lactobacillus delbrueckii]